MVRLACVNVPRVDLQILALADSDLKALPTAVVTEAKPLGRILEVNRAGRAEGVLPGMRYAAALHICPQLRAGTVSREEREALRKRLIDVLSRFSPDVEPSQRDAMLFWLDASGLGRLYASDAAWAADVERELDGIGLFVSIAVGFTRFGTCTAARVKRAITLFDTPRDERTAALRAPIGVLPIEPDALMRLHHLGVYTVRDFVRFEPGALRRRFGPEVEELRRFAADGAELPVQGAGERRPLRRDVRLLHPERSIEALLHHQTELLRAVIAQARDEQCAITEIVMEFCPEQWPGHDEPCLTERIRTARPTLDAARIERLMRLRMEHGKLEHGKLRAPIVSLTLEAVCVSSTREQHDLFGGQRTIEYEQAAHALSDITAELGNDAVQFARLETSHLPEHSFSWQNAGRGWQNAGGGLQNASLAVKRPPPAIRSTDESDRPAGLLTPPGYPQLVRRILEAPVPLSSMPDEFQSPRIAGPYTLSGGWWNHPYQREYYYLYDRFDRALWIYFDVNERRWMLQGIVE